MTFEFRLIKNRLPYGGSEIAPSIKQDDFNNFIYSLILYDEYENKATLDGKNMYFRDSIILYESMHDMKYENQRTNFITETISKILSLIDSHEDAIHIIAQMTEEAKIEEKIYHTRIIMDYLFSVVKLSYRFKFRYTLPYDYVTAILASIGSYEMECHDCNIPVSRHY